MADDLNKVLRKLRVIDRKLDVIIESQDLEDALKRREAEDSAKFAENTEVIAEQFRKSRPTR
jgi:hypothetical protein